MSGDPFFSSGVGTLRLRAFSGQSADVAVLLLDDKPMGIEMVLGVPAISALGGVVIGSPSDVVLWEADFTSRSRQLKRSSGGGCTRFFSTVRCRRTNVDNVVEVGRRSGASQSIQLYA